MTDNTMREALADASLQPTLDEIVKAAIAHGVEDAPDRKNEMRHRRIVSMVRALFAARYQAAQSVPVLGETVAWRYRSKSTALIRPVRYVTTQKAGSDEEWEEEELVVKPTTSITTQELHKIREYIDSGIESEGALEADHSIEARRLVAIIDAAMQGNENEN